FGRESGAELRGSADLAWLQHEHVGHAVDHHAHHPRLEVEYHHHGLMVVFDVGQVELDAHVDDRHDDTTQVRDTLHKGRHVGDAGHRLGIVAADLLNLENIDAVFLVGEREDQVFLASGFRRAELLINMIGHDGAPECCCKGLYGCQALVLGCLHEREDVDDERHTAVAKNGGRRHARNLLVVCLEVLDHDLMLADEMVDQQCETHILHLQDDGDRARHVGFGILDVEHFVQRHDRQVLTAHLHHVFRLGNGPD